MPSLLRRSVAELLGTFALVFFGIGSVASKVFPDATYGILGIAVAHGLVLAVMVTAVMGISGGHLNPAVTLGLLAARRTDARSAAAYIVAQLLGAVLAALMIKLAYPVGAIRSISLATPALANTVQFHQAMILEGVMTFFLVSAVFGTMINPVAPNLGGLGVGLDPAGRRPGGRTAHRGGGEPRPCLRPGVGLRTVGGTRGLLGGADRGRSAGGAAVGARPAETREEEGVASEA